MNIQIKYFGILSELTGCNQEIIDLEKTTISDLLKLLYKKYNLLEDKIFQIVQNQVRINNDSELSGEEIALLSAFSGG